MASFYQFREEFPDDDACLHHLMVTRYGGTEFDCPKCKRASKFHRVRAERNYVCQWCGHHIYPCVGTMMEGSPTPLHKWFYAMFLFSHSRHGVSAKELQRQFGVTYKTAWRMAHMIRKQMASLESRELLQGEIEADETYVGGKRPGKPGRGAAGKTVVFGVLERDGEIRPRVVPNVRRHTLEPIIQEAVRVGSTVYTDELATYNRLGEAGFVHESVHHRAWEFARPSESGLGNCHVNGLEGFWARLKLSIRGTHVWVSGKHLWKYVGEFAWRYNHRKQPELMFGELVASL